MVEITRDRGENALAKKEEGVVGPHDCACRIGFGLRQSVFGVCGQVKESSNYILDLLERLSWHTCTLCFVYKSDVW
jgi:hypothetical protein